MSKRPRDGRAADPTATRARKKATGPTGKSTSTEDLALWHYAARAVMPLRKAKSRVPDVGAPPELAPKVWPAPAQPPAAPPTTPARHGAKAPPAHPAKTAPPKPPPPLVPIERRKARRIARGTVEIDARIDLHGLRQADAERRLRRFLLGARAEGLRTVLVITGKGGERDAGEARDDIERSPRGVLRRNVPLWLEQPDLRDCVAGIGAAHIRHGGTGALYIHLRKPRGR